MPHTHTHTKGEKKMFLGKISQRTHIESYIWEWYTRIIYTTCSLRLNCQQYLLGGGGKGGWQRRNSKTFTLLPHYLFNSNYIGMCECEWVCKDGKLNRKPSFLCIQSLNARARKERKLSRPVKWCGEGKTIKFWFWKSK